MNMPAENYTLTVSRPTPFPLKTDTLFAGPTPRPWYMHHHVGPRTPPKWCTAAGHMVHPAAGEITLSYPCACALTRPRSEPCTRCR